MRPQRNIEINDKIPDESDQNNKPEEKIWWQISDRNNQQEKIIEDKGTVQLQNLSTDIEKMNRKESNNKESDKSDTK